MPFIKYEAITATKVTPEIRVGKLGISIAKSAWERLGLGDAKAVNLWYDSEAGVVAITFTAPDDKSGFKVTLRGKSKDSIFLGAGKFYGRFGIPVVGTITSTFEEIEGMPAFLLSDKPKNDEAPKLRRGRKPKDKAA